MKMENAQINKIKKFSEILNQKIKKIDLQYLITIKRGKCWIKFAFAYKTEADEDLFKSQSKK